VKSLPMVKNIHSVLLFERASLLAIVLTLQYILMLRFRGQNGGQTEGR
jgi:hypothetical protein